MDQALNQAVLTSFDQRVYRDYDLWRTQFTQAKVHVQWDPERTLRGKSLPIRSIQVGISRHVIELYVKAWVVQITDITPVVRKIHHLVQSGHEQQARDFLPREKVYPLPLLIAHRLGMTSGS